MGTMIMARHIVPPTMMTKMTIDPVKIIV